MTKKLLADKAKLIVAVGLVFSVIHLVISLFFSRFCEFNNGISFSLLRDENFLLIILLNAFVTVGIFLYSFYLRRKGYVVWIYVLGISFAGLGNLIDRIANTAVCDYIRLFGWPVFNLNDLLITVYILLIIFLSFKYRNGA